MNEDGARHGPGWQGTPEAFTIAAPKLDLPKGGGAVRGIGEKFGTNPVTGTGRLSIPIPTSPSRGGFAPQLVLTYDSGSGNSIFGFGWSLALPTITRKTAKGLPRYADALESDVFLLNDSEDLVPELDTAGVRWRDITTAPGYTIDRYRPRIEGAFARIERWTHEQSGVHWRSISPDNVTTVYGEDDASRVRDPFGERRVFSWLACRSYDDKGNAIEYRYRADDGRGIDYARASETNRGDASDDRRKTNRYPDRIRYGNVTPYYATTLGDRTASAAPPSGWMFEVAFQYEGEDHLADVERDAADGGEYVGEARVAATAPWRVRKDPFSTYRPGFEVRTTRRCTRVLLFHHFAELGRADYLVRSLDLTYAYGVDRGAFAVASYLVSAAQRAYEVVPDGPRAGHYRARAYPPLELTYSEASIDDTLREVGRASLANVPVGIDAGRYQWVDLDGEGASGILTEQDGAWSYKRNLSAANVYREPGPTAPREITRPRFEVLEHVPTVPSFAVTSGRGTRLLDLAGDGSLDVVEFDGPTPGYFKRTADAGWATFVPFRSRPTIDWSSPSLRFVDLTGDGHADALVTEHDAFTWHASLGEEGFAPAERVPQALDEARGPRVVFRGGAETIFLADMSGDGLTDLVRIRNGEACYWPNLGYGRFGARVVMDDAPWLDHPDRFDPARIRLADVDGSGTTDVVYLGSLETRVYHNLSGNAWSEGHLLASFPPADDAAQVDVLDLLGTGTGCIVWSSPLPGDATAPLRYVDLMGGQKPHLITRVRNNLGAETEVRYVPSTRFYLEDALAGTPWVTRLPFPVHCVASVTARDAWRHTEFTTIYTYHHGYFDGVEREFRGFGRVTHVDTQRFGVVAAANAVSPFVTQDLTLYQPPVKRVTWFHTGVALDRARILDAYAHEYFPARVADRFAAGASREKDLTKARIAPTPNGEPALDAEEWREAMRACKGMALRTETFELDVAALHDRGEHVPVRLYSVEQHDCLIRRVQPRGDNRHAVFLVMESESLAYAYDLDLRDATLAPDPRVSHTLNLRFDDYGRATQSVAVVYARHGQHADAALDATQLGVIRQVQGERHIAYSETRYAEPPPTGSVVNHRRPAPCEVLTYELTGTHPTAGFAPQSPPYFSVDDFAAYRLSDTLPGQGTRPVAPLAYQKQPPDGVAHKRLVERALSRFLADDLTGPLAFGHQGWLGLTHESYRLALTESLLEDVLEDKYDAEARAALDAAAAGAAAGFLASGYATGTTVSGAGGPAAEWWMRSGIAGLATDAWTRFYQPEYFTDAFGRITTVAYDTSYRLYVTSTTDPVANTVSVSTFDFRVLAPSRVEDANGNVTEAAFDLLGLPVAVAQRGKVRAGPPETGETGDDLADIERPYARALASFFTAPQFQARAVRRWLGKATARFVYHFGESIDPAGVVTWGVQPASACTILRERHESDLPNVDSADPVDWIPVQVVLEYSDGVGAVFVKKLQAEPDPDAVAAGTRWIANGKTVVNNKGSAVKQYEPYFTDDHRYDEPAESGVSPVMFYDAAGRLVRTELPDGAVSRVEFTPWLVRRWDQNDAVLESRWYRERLTALERGVAVALSTDEEAKAQAASAADKGAASLAAKHARTPAESHVDSLGREAVTIVHNTTPSESSADESANVPLVDRVWTPARTLTFTKLDAEGKPLWIKDALGRLVMQYVRRSAPTSGGTINELEPAAWTPAYDIAGNLLFQHSMDAGDRWMLADAAGQPMLAWDYNERTPDGGGTALREHRRFRATYDALHRPVARFLRLAVEGEPAGAEALIEAWRYGEGVAQDRALNLRGQLRQHYDASGVSHAEAFDYAARPLTVRRRLASDVQAYTFDWTGCTLDDVLTAAAPGFDADVFTQRATYDALGRTTRLDDWHREPAAGAVARVAVYEPAYNERGLLVRESLTVGARTMAAIARVDYDAKGQRTRCDRGNGTVTRYDYDPETFRLRAMRTTRPGFAPPFPQPRGQLADARVLQHLHYAYDAVGNVTDVHDDAWAPAFFGNQQVDAANGYVYDARYRLIRATGRENGAAVGASQPIEVAPARVPRLPVTAANALRNYTQRYHYDAVGNIRQVRHISSTGGWTRDYAYATDSNRLAGTDTDDPVGGVTYGYDTHGSMLNLDAVPSAYALRWGLNDMIRTIHVAADRDAWYQYGSDKQRCRKRIVSTATGAARTVAERIYLGGYELYRRYGGNPSTPVEEIESHHVLDGTERVLLVEDVLATDAAGGPTTRWRYQYGNHLGSLGLELDDAAAVISYEEYHPYGTSAYRIMTALVEVPASRYRYTGMERDEESGLSYHSARYYAPWLARWLSGDPTGASGGLNLYAYVDGNPVRLVDPAGTRPAKLFEQNRLNYLRMLVDMEQDRYDRRPLPFKITATILPGGPIGRSNTAQAHLKAYTAAIERAKEGEEVHGWDISTFQTTMYHDDEGNAIAGLQNVPNYQTASEVYWDRQLQVGAAGAASPISAVGYVVADVAGASEQAKTSIALTGAALWDVALGVSMTVSHRAWMQSLNLNTGSDLANERGYADVRVQGSEYHWMDNPGGISAAIYPGGTLATAIQRGGNTPGTVLFLKAMGTLRSQVTAVLGNWGTEMPSNLDMFNANLRAGMTPEGAARATYTGKWAGSFGFTRVEVDYSSLQGTPGNYTKVQVMFTPGDGTDPVYLRLNTPPPPAK